ncbi:MAG: HPr family phosphocarrier protein [Clostridiales bacterium]|nr:HPr family phosphocarrier protein [Clostridiales bacterium]
MISTRVRIMHDSGLNARPAALFVQVSSKYDSRIWVEVGTKKVNAKSIMGIMTLNVAPDDEITIIAQGEDAQEAIDSLTELVDSNFSHIPDCK